MSDQESSFFSVWCWRSPHSGVPSSTRILPLSWIDCTAGPPQSRLRCPLLPRHYAVLVLDQQYRREASGLWVALESLLVVFEVEMPEEIEAGKVV